MERVNDQTGHVSRFKFAHQIGAVRFNGTDTQTELSRDFFARVAVRDKRKHFFLALA